MKDYDFLYASYEDIKKGRTTDIYFLRTVKVLESDGLGNVEVHAEVTPSGLPKGYKWALLGGLRDAIKLLEGLPVDVDAMPEGSVFYNRDFYGVKEPIMTIRGPYARFAIYETPLLGFIASGSGILTKAARLRKVAGKGVILLSFDARRAHPAISPFNAYYAYLGGFDGVSCVKGAELLGIEPSGTMPHSLIIIYEVIKGDQAEAWKAFDKYLPKGIPRVVLVDTYLDERAEALRALSNLGAERVYGLRLDTPSSRRGDFPHIVREVKWELKARGYDPVKIFVSGGIDEESIPPLVKSGVDGFGIGSALANAPLIDVALDIVAVKKGGKWVPAAKRGKFTGIKKVYRCPDCLVDVVRLEGEEEPRCPKCGKEMEEVLKPVIRGGKIVGGLEKPEEVRRRVLEQLEKLTLENLKAEGEY
ncbi:MAG: nicotinate phosphoribosyltransferase [Thermofilum sp. ex4484_15]|nr:MAG: nicotinate phosphoribosyltransferase [Thermofilum sp. ex4484_15]